MKTQINFNTKRKLFISTFIAMALALTTFSQQNGARIAATTGLADPSAMLDVVSSSKGFLCPRMIAAERTAISTPAEGLLVYQTDSPAGFWYYNGSSWVQVSSGSGTSNYLPKWTSANTLGNSLVFDDGTNVGIGTTSPAGSLDIGTWDGWSSPALRFSKNTGSEKDIRIINDAEGLAIRDFTGTSGNIFNIRTADDEQRLVVNNSGNVGIGASDPPAVLTIQEDLGSFKSQVRLKGTVEDIWAGSEISAWGFNFNAPIFRQLGAIKFIMDIGLEDPNMSSSVRFYNTQGSTLTEVMRISSDGNVGIGTTNPATNLDVAGSMQVQYFGDTRISIKNNEIGGTTWSWANDWENRAGFSLIQEGSAGDRIFVDTSGNVGFGTVTPSERLHINGNLSLDYPYSTAYITFGKHETAGDSREIRLFENPGGTNIYGLRYKYTGAYYYTGILANGNENIVVKDNGMVGIGTNNPGARLHLQGNSGEDMLRSTIGSAYWQLGQNAGTGIGNDDFAVYSSTFAASNGYVPIMTFKNNGKVGIGTTSPSYKLTVAGGSLRVTGTGEPGDPATRVGVIYENNSGGIPGWWLSQNSNGKFAIHQDGTGDRLTIDGGGNVGIGTSTPGARLSLGDGVGQKLYVYEEGSIRLGFGVDLSGSTRELAVFHTTSGSDGDISFGKRLESTGAYTEAMRITGSGDVGIGTASPGAKLEVAGQVKITGGSPGAGKVLTSDGSGLASWTTPSAGIGGSGNTNYISKWTGGTTLGNSSIYDNGKVGIGTANPSSPLHVVQNATSSNIPAILGENTNTHGYGIGVKGEGKMIGVKGVSIATHDYQSSIGVSGYGEADGSGNNEAYGGDFTAFGYGTGDVFGVKGWAAGQTTGNKYGGWFYGNVHVTGTISKGGGSFQIDHPLDPENKYLYHSFVESPDMKNIYDGLVMLDNQGKATVQLPAWFEALNYEFRYQLTPVGAPAPDLYISQEISGNSFAISGGKPGMKVSWMVTGIRHDPFAEKNRIPVEVEKREKEKNLYLYPDAYDQPEEKGIDFQRENKMKKQEEIKK
jgi:hypothetical protein